MRVLSHLRGIQSAITDGKFQEEFPEFTGLDEKILSSISRQEIDLNQALKSCGLSGVDEIESEPEEE